MRLMAPGGHKYGGMLATLTGMVRCEGWQALYSGCLPAVIGMAPAGAVYYGAWPGAWGLAWRIGLAGPARPVPAASTPGPHPQPPQGVRRARGQP
jgi:hypothetical protein